ncbi:hypothetical protein H1C71_034236 [Ictidomys tridecemlineatus]|nr:hypothetical protein H1C71_034236 [Ictidomys tridecemlineatus]
MPSKSGCYQIKLFPVFSAILGTLPCPSLQQYNSIYLNIIYIFIKWSTDVINYVMVQMFPIVLYHDAGSFKDKIRRHTSWFRWEPVALTLAILLEMGIAAGVGTRTTALVRGTQQMTQLKTTMDQNLKILKTSITALQESLTSLSKVVLQNR